MAGTILQVIGLQRSGNHAIISWLASLFRAPDFLNNRHHDFFLQEAERARLRASAADCVIVSFEDAVRKFVHGRHLVRDIAPLRAEDFPGTRCLTLHILRDPYNNWASRVVAAEKRGLTGVPELATFIDSWLDLAAIQARDPDAVILYDRWAADAGYRRRICAAVGGRYSEATLDDIPAFGGGSSFQGRAQRPSYRQIAGRLPHYLSRRFLRRLRQAPAAYARRLVSPRLAGRQLETGARWRAVVGRDECRPLFADARLAAESDRIFGFHVGEDGVRVAAEGARPAAAGRGR